MTAQCLLTCRGSRSQKRWAVVTMMAMIVSTAGGPSVVPIVSAQTSGAPVGAGFTLDAGDLRFIFRQIQIAEAHAAGGGSPFGTGENQVHEVRHPFGLRTVDGSFNHIQSGTETFGAADQLFPRMTTPLFRQAEDHTFDPDGPGPIQAGDPSSYEQKKGIVSDSRPRTISNLIVDQTEDNPAAVAVAFAQNPDVIADPLGTLPILNVAPDVGLSAPFNIMFTFFGQFFDHGLDLTNKGGGAVFVPLQPDDPLFIPGSPNNFMVLTRATNVDCDPAAPGCIPDGVGDNPATPADESANDRQEATNQTTPWVDQNQTYTSHPSHQVFLREYVMNAGRPVSTGRMIDGGGAGVRNIGNWGEVKAQAATMLGIRLVDTDVFNVPLLATDPYGRFLRGSNGFPLMMMQVGPPVQGNPSSPISTVGARRTGHGFLDDIAHAANPSSPGYDQALLNAHFVTGDGRGNENIALTAVHTVFHAEHNRLRDNIHGLINTVLTATEIAAWNAVSPQPPAGSGWDYGERLFQAARFVTEMQYQHLVFEEFARKVSPAINPFIGDGINFVSNINPAIVAEFAHQTYRLGHSMLTERISRTNQDGSENDIQLLDGFLNPRAFNDGGTAGALTAAQAAGAIFRGGARQVANEIDEFVTEAVRNNLVGLPLDLAVLNLARGRSEGIAPLNSVRRQLHAASGDFALVPYESWFDFTFNLKHAESLINFIAAYGTHPSVANATTIADKRRAAVLIVSGAEAALPGEVVPPDRLDFLFGMGSWANGTDGVTTTGLDSVDLWIGGLAERISPFGGLLGTTFNFIFEVQLENLQNADRFYYLERLDGLNLLSQLEGNSFVELIQRNTTLNGDASADVFARPDLVFNLSAQNASGPIVDDLSTPDVDERLELVRMPNGTIRYPGTAHVIWNGRNDATGDRVFSSEGDDTLRGNGGNDIMEGGAGNDQHLGGAGDDILTDTFGEDVIKGGPGNDAISGGAGPFDLLQGNEGNDFIVGGPDLSEVFGGPGNDIIYMGKGLSESIGGSGDDWMEGTESPASIAIGDDNNQFQDDPNGGHDILIVGLGDTDMDAEGGDDIMVGSVLPTHRFEGMLGFDWVTYRGETLPVDADMALVGPPDLNLDELRDRFDLTEALSGYDQNDVLRGDSRLDVDMVQHELAQAGIDRIVGLRPFLVALVGNAAASPAFVFTGGNIIMGGAGSDVIEGRGGNDLIDGDAWLNAQLRAPNPATPDPSDFQLVNSLQALKADVFAGRIQLSDASGASTITFVRSIVTTNSEGIDTAVFSGPRVNYTIVGPSPSGIVTVTDNVGLDGTDRLRNIERLQFADVTLSTGNNAPTGSPVLTQTLPQEGEALSVQNGTIADSDGIVAGSFAIQWQQGTAGGGGFVDITGATLRAFTPVQAQVGGVLRAIVSFTDGAGRRESVPSAASGVVGDLFQGTAANENYTGTAGRDDASGGGGNDILTTGDAADVVRGQGGNDTINTLAGNDTAIGGAGDDIINSGDGDDSIRFNQAEGFDAVNGGTGQDEIRANVEGAVIGLTSLTAVEAITAGGLAGVTIQGSDAANTLNFSAVTLTGIDSINGGGGADLITGGAGADTINGEAGADTINGGPGADTISGGADNDAIAGGAGADTINGNGGNDVITGGAGNDNTNPGATLGNDVFVFAATFGNDTINGFGPTASLTVGQDLLDLRPLGIRVATFAASVTIAASGVSNTLITVRVPGTTTVTGTITLVGVAPATVTAADFILAP